MNGYCTQRNRKRKQRKESGGACVHHQWGPVLTYTPNVRLGMDSGDESRSLMSVTPSL